MYKQRQKLFQMVLYRDGRPMVDISLKTLLHVVSTHLNERNHRDLKGIVMTTVLGLIELIKAVALKGDVIEGDRKGQVHIVAHFDRAVGFTGYGTQCHRVCLPVSTWPSTCVITVLLKDCLRGIECLPMNGS